MSIDSEELEIAIKAWKKSFRDRAFKYAAPQTYTSAFRDGWAAARSTTNAGTERNQDHEDTNSQGSQRMELK